MPGLRLQHLYPEVDFTDWLTELIELRATKAIDRQFWNLTESTDGDIFQVDIRWWDDVLLLTATYTVPEGLARHLSLNSKQLT